MTKLILHPSHHFKSLKRYIITMILLATTQFFWGCIIFFLNQKEEFQKLYLNFFYNENIYILFNIYSMYSILHSLYIILACFLSYFLRSKNWFRSAILFNLIPFVGFLFGIIQIPVSIFLFKKINSKDWNDFFKHYDSFSSMQL